jgi:hypothetical protein
MSPSRTGVNDEGNPNHELQGGREMAIMERTPDGKICSSCFVLRH